LSGLGGLTLSAAQIAPTFRGLHDHVHTPRRHHLFACLAGGLRHGQANDAAVQQRPAGRAAIGAFGIDLASRDMNVKPGDDFFQHVNGTWFANNTIPDDRTTWGTNAILQEKAERDVRTIIEEAALAGGAPGSNTQKIADYYNAYLDQDAIDARGLAPIQPALAEIAALRTHEQVMRLISRPDIGISSPIDVYVTLDEGNPDRYITAVTHGGLGLPEREYYRKTDGVFPEQRTPIQSHDREYPSN
jgi:putative endopeptidase